MVPHGIDRTTEPMDSASFSAGMITEIVEPISAVYASPGFLDFCFQFNRLDIAGCLSSRLDQRTAKFVDRLSSAMIELCGKPSDQTIRRRPGIVGKFLCKFFMLVGAVR
jgi:hypothetical protein